MKKVVNSLCILLGFVFLGVGVIGVILPILPTTPFLMAAALLFAKGSVRFHRWFLSTGLYKKYVEPAFGQRAMERHSKIKAMATLFIIFTVSFFIVPIWHAKAAILIVAFFHFYYFAFKIKTLGKNSIQVSEVTEDVS